jgi:glycosyltransferase involved in cell wall biosynthesis
LNPMRLGFHYHVPATMSDGGIFMPGFQGLFVDGLAAHCREIVCFLHMPNDSERGLMDYRIRSANVRLISIGPHSSVPRRTLLARRFCSPLRSRRQELDTVLLRGASPLLPAMAAAARPLPLVLLIVSRCTQGIDDLAQPWWRKNLIHLWARMNEHQQNKVAMRALTFVNSRQYYNELKERLPQLRETRTTTLTAGDFFERLDTCQKPPYHLLFAGRMDRGKGLLEIVEALALLLAAGQDVVLDLVGWPEPGDPVLEEVKVLASRKGIADRVLYHGRKSIGPELFAYYKQADVFVVASKAAEGFPRTIWEAMAHSVPVVATTVGSIPHHLGAAAALVPPNDAAALSNAIRTLLAAPRKRQELIRRGHQLALDMTLEKQSRQMVAEIESWIERSK